MTKRNVGILLPIAALPSNQGIGDFGKHAYHFIDALCEQHIKIWQILPFHPLGYGNSPYQTFSAFAGDEIFINVDTLSDYGLLKLSSLRNYNKFKNRVDYAGVRKFKEPYLRKAYKSFKKQYANFISEYQLFCATADWLYPYAIFMTLKKHNKQKPWMEWPQEQRDWVKNRKCSLEEYDDDIAYEQFIQYIFYKQWGEIKRYANEHGVEIMGDLPFYVSLDSADVWQYQEDFLLDKDGNPTSVAGVPPDYFSKTGQRWGYPLYNWEKMKKDHYAFWMHRFAWHTQYFDRIRLDHFRAFDTYWKISATCPTAVKGEWMPGPSYAFFDELYAQMPDICVVAEDLGDLRKQALILRDYYHLVGMNVIQFDLIPKQLKQGYCEHVMLYTGTHDNDTIEGFYQGLSANRKTALRRFFHKHGFDENSMHSIVIQYCLASEATSIMIQAQDLLGLKSDARMNTPNTVGSPNWEWKLKNLKEVYAVLPRLGELIKEYNRW